MIYNRIHVAFGSLRKITGPALQWQYNEKQYLIINDLTLPEVYAVDFMNQGDAKTIRMTPTEEGVLIPDQLLLDGRPLIAYIVVIDGDSVNTIAQATFLVNTRGEPSDISPEPAKQQQIDSLIAAMNNAVTESADNADRAGTEADRAEQSATDAASDADRAESAADSAEDSAALLENCSAEAETLPAGSQATASYSNGVFNFGVPQGKQGIQGDPFTYEDFTEEQKQELVDGPILDAQTAAVNAVGAAGTTAVGAVNQTGSTQVAAVNRAGATQVHAVEDKGKDVLDSIPPDYSDLADDVSQLNAALSQIWSDQIVGMTPTERQKESVNLFKYAELVGAGKAIYAISNGKVVLTDNASYNTYLIQVDGESTYTFTNCRSAVLVSDRNYTAVSQLLTYVTSINSTGGKYIIFSFSPTTYPESAYSVTKPVGVYTIPSNWDLSDVEIQTTQINGMLPTGRNVKSSNLFPKAVNVGTGKYVDRIQNGKAVLVYNGNYDTYLIPVDGSSVYSFTNCRTAAVVSDLQYTAVGALLANTTSIDSTGGSYILFSFNPTTYPVDAYSVTKPVPQYTIPADWALDDGAKQSYQIKAGSIASGGALSLSGKTAVKYGQRIAFKGFITTFNEIQLAFYNYNNSAISNSIVVDANTMTVYVGSTAVDTFTHGVTIANDISLIIDYLVTGVEITLESNGAKYKAQTTWERLTSGVVSAAVKSNGTVCTSAMLVMAIERVEKPIWYFGDSYISYTNQARWPYYLIQYKFDGNTLLNGYAGGTSAADMMAFEALLNYGTPKFAVFATGMNDNARTGGDTASEAAPAWVSARNNFLALCDANGITPVFCTVPTVPSVNNQKKNEWIRGSGYRYIDFAKAVGANADGKWYGNGTQYDMLSSDNVHPTERGAVALFTQAITDFPEFLS